MLHQSEIDKIHKQNKPKIINDRNCQTKEQSVPKNTRFSMFLPTMKCAYSFAKCLF